MKKFTVEKMPSGSSVFDTMRISGFNEGELEYLKYQENAIAKDMLVIMLNSRNDGLGNKWAFGNGICSLWFDNEYAYMNIRKEGTQL